MIMPCIIDLYKFMYLVETPLLGIYFTYFSVKMDILEGKANPVLKIYAYLIISKSEKQKKKTFENIRKLSGNFHHFPGILWIEISPFPGPFFSTTKIGFYMSF